MTQIDGGIALNLPLPQARPAPLRLVLVEDHAVLRDGLKALLALQSDVIIVGDYDCVQSCLHHLHRLQPDIVVVDLALPNRSGIELISEIQHLSPRSSKLVLTGNDGAEYIRAAFSAGADGYVIKDASCTELMLAIRTVSTGRRYLCKGIALKVLSGYLSPHQTPPTSGSQQFRHGP